MKQRIRTLAITVALLAGMALPLFAAGGATTITFWNYWDGTNGEALNKLIADYEKQNPNVKIENVFIGWGELLTKLQLAAASGKGPDLAAVDLVWMPLMAKTGKLVDLKPLAVRDKVDLSDLYPELLKPGASGGAQLSLPVSANNLELFYNKDLFRAAGLDPERPPRTWDELRAYAAKMTDAKKGSYGMELYTGKGEGLTWQAQVYLWQKGGDFLSKDNKSAAFASTQGEEAFGYLVDLVQKDKVSPLASWGLFDQGLAGMVMDGSWKIGSLKASSAFDWGTAAIPVPAGGSPATNMGGEQIFVMKGDAARQEAAWKFLAWLVSPEVQVRWCEATGFMPTRAKVETSADYAAWVAGFEPRLKPFIENQKYAHARPGVANYTELSDLFSAEMERSFYGKASVKDALKAASSAVNAKLR